MFGPRLTTSERELLNAILDAYRSNAEWPQFGALHRQLAQSLRGELNDVASSLLRKLGAPQDRLDWDVQVQLPVRGIRLDPHIEETYAVLMRGLPLLKQFYLTAKEKPRVTHQYFLDKGWNQGDATRLFRLLRNQHLWSSMGGDEHGTTWVVDLNPDVVRYANFQSASQLWAWRLKQEQRHRRWLRSRNSSRRHRVREGGSWIERHLVPTLLGVLATVVAGAILWRLGLN